MSRPSFGPEALATLERRWRSLAAEAGASYFQDWGWVGCMAVERYADPVLIEIHDNDKLVALALFNRRLSRRDGTSLHLQESADAELASIFVEHNGPLVAIADPVLRQALLARLLYVAMNQVIDATTTRPRRLVLSGVGPADADAVTMAGGVVDVKAVRVAPFVDFTAYAENRPFIDRLSRNTRYQLRRSNRDYAAKGALTVSRAETVEEGMMFFAEMKRFHDLKWEARGKKGAFATASVRRFYQTLLGAGIPSGEVDLLHVSAGSITIGYLMNFYHNGTVSAYQSGFDYAGAGPYQKPGLTSHYLAIEAYRSRGARAYDFLAGADRYKLSLANAQRWLHWVSTAPSWHPSSVGARLRHLLQA